ncbi:uncharacterized protein LOC131211964 [Anopheles bellator]|uniref:uncharacterized protein LOC131211964 n=1 Tax=Anopheles bellator TaxID=139047 RepID=UPI00264892EA|nr:uncharacterized protein LOC131211964 [Anopheles bellator]
MVSIPNTGEMGVVKLVVALVVVLGTVTVLAAGPRPEPPSGPVPKTGGPGADGPKSVVAGKKAPHGKREVASYGLSLFPQQQQHQHHHGRYSFGGHPQLAELYAPATSHGGYSYSIPQHSAVYPAAYGSHKLFVSPATSSLKYTPAAASSHAFFSPHGHYGSFNGFSDGPVKYGSFGSKDLSELLKQLHTTVGPLTIKPVPSSYGSGYGSFGEHHEHVFDTNSLHLKPVTFKLQELPSFHGAPVPQALTAPAGPTSSSSTYGHVTHSLGYEPSYTHGVKGLRHYSTPNVPAGDLYSGNKYVSSLGLGQPSQHGASMVSPLHTSVHSVLATQKPFKPSTYLGSSHETISAPSNAHVHTHPPSGSYLAPSLQYLPPVNKHPLLPPKLSYDSPAKHGYLPPAPSTNAYLPPHGKPTNTYLPPVASGGHSNYIPLAASASESHEETVVRQPLHHHHHHQDSNESLDYSGASAAPTPTADTPSGHWKH